MTVGFMSRKTSQMFLLHICSFREIFLIEGPLGLLKKSLFMTLKGEHLTIVDDFISVFIVNAIG